MIWGFDTETHLISPGCLAPRLVCGTIANDDQGALLLDREETIDWYRVRLAGADHLVGCRITYDLGVLCAEDESLITPTFKAVSEGRIHSVDVREALIDIGRGALSNEFDEEAGLRYSLAMLVQRYLGLDISGDKDGVDAWRLRYNELDGVPLGRWPWPAVRYPLRDAVFPLQIYNLQEGGINLHDETRQTKADWALHLMSMWGLRTDKDRVEKLIAEAEAEWLATREELGPKGPGIFRADHTKDMKRLALFVAAAYDGSPPMTATGKVATDRDTLVESGNPLLEKLGNAGKNDKRINTYGPLLLKGVKHPWNPRSNVLVATGRASGDGQQLPTGDRSKGGVRECFCPRPGHAYSSNDYPGLELFTASERAYQQLGFSKMGDLLLSGQDCHAYVAAQFMNKPYEEVLEFKKKMPYKGFRDVAKIFNFGRLGGMGNAATTYNAREKNDVRFCVTTGEAEICGDMELASIRGKHKPICSLCLRVASRLGKRWLEALPEQKELARLAGLATEMGDASVTVPFSNRVRGGCRYTQWLNTPFQGLGGDLAKDALWRVSYECYVDRSSVLYGSRIVLFVHDEIICEHPLSVAGPAAERVARIMEETAVDWLPTYGKAVKVDPAISLVMSKSMATVRDDQGRLQLWTP